MAEKLGDCPCGERLLECSECAHDSLRLDASLEEKMREALGEGVEHIVERGRAALQRVSAEHDSTGCKLCAATLGGVDPA
jgi:hypothetical protein